MLLALDGDNSILFSLQGIAFPVVISAWYDIDPQQ
jgi:hypothetical protein